ncbi:phage tail protein [Stenotrophomonas maltophilia]|uniref:phage tail protein n=1 Tax=Stenotrophomonas maltophilia TaxID=40324 RepID=UPI0015DD881F|nr:phage tail protein [Stenotrophomonas maltophilia]MBA0371166.1 phage tail protein [Stenotrophomonas maltophilia]MBH1558497.1 phage tail protein [Stenotrophomonas maltophilia]MCI1140317.1 phage tail protein [Stenotrophomonas maltophilia]HDX0800944.1 phage tail protein [Stenotrophomonas maltophilia]HDX0814893.1 phage tail protein [Stenotrophomonas maltophilia]
MMMSLGTFVFSLSTAAYQQLQRQMSWRHPTSERVGARAARQYVGPGEETIDLSGVIHAELADDLLTLDVLRELAAEGRPLALVEGNGTVYGAYVILSINEGRTEFFSDGTPRRIDFQLQLARTDDDAEEAAA